jgi:protein-tyrosine phosphatase
VTVVRFPDGTAVLARGVSGSVPDPPPEFGLYLDPAWDPPWPTDRIAWEDYGVPDDADAAARSIRDAFTRARFGERVEIGCVGGFGRTGTVLACMATLAGVSVDESVEWVRDAYHPQAVETPNQEDWVRWFASTTNE